MAKDRLGFPEGFMWGTATAGHQVEGHNDKSDWWQFEQAGKVEDGTKSGASVDYWNRYEEDHALMNELGYPAFRLGVEWAKIEPEDGRINKEAVERYHKIFKSLRDHKIKICLTIYHWVLPNWFAERGGWLRADAVKRFLKFTEVVVKEFGDYPDIWVTLNEPTVPTSAGYFAAVFPPEKANIGDFLKATEALLRAHAGAYKLIHDNVAKAPGGGPVLAGIAHAYQKVQPYGTPGMAAVFEKVMSKFYAFFSFKCWDRALMTGTLPIPYILKKFPGLKDSCDFAGVNYYTRYSPRFDKTLKDQMFVDIMSVPEGAETTQMGWEIYPQGFYDTLMYVSNYYKKPIYILENGIADDTDSRRPSYTLEHLAKVHKAISDGADIRGYFHWTFIDNFEWKEGFAKKFGLVACDHTDPKLERKPRPSAHMYSSIIKANAITTEIADEYAPEVKGEIFG